MAPYGGDCGNLNMVTMTVESPDPGDARNILETALEIYPETARFVLGTIQFNLLDTPQTPTGTLQPSGTGESTGDRNTGRSGGRCSCAGYYGVFQAYSQDSGRYETVYQSEMSGGDPVCEIQGPGA